MSESDLVVYRRMQKKLRLFMTGIGCLIALLGLFLAIFFYFDIEEQKTFQARGVWVDATIVGKDIVRGSRSDKRSSETEFWLTYTYLDGRNRAHTARNKVSGRAYSDATPGGTHRIAYLPEDPSRHLSRAEVES